MHKLKTNPLPTQISPPSFPPPKKKPTMPFLHLLLFLFIIILPSTVTAAATARCTPTTTLKPYQKCLTLPTQDATFEWTYHPRNATLDAAFSGSFISPSGWVAWGINPDSPQMTGTRSLVAFSDPTSGLLVVLPFVLDPSVKLQTSPLVSRPLDNPRLLSSSAALLASSPSVRTGAHVEIHATIILNPNRTKLNLVWNRGLYVQGYSPTIHPTTVADLSSRVVIDLLSSSATIKPTILDSLRPVHAVLNALSWGFCLPVGVVTARYLRQCPNAGPSWFYAHAAIQIPGFLMGAAGFAIGIVMGAASVGVVYELHRGLGIAAFCMGGLQAAALMLRPGMTNRYRKYWKSYHHLVGYGCVVVGVVNVFQGFEVMGLGRSYAKLAYCVAVATLLGLCVALEANAWVVFCRKAEEEKVRREGNEGMKGSGSL